MELERQEPQQARQCNSNQDEDEGMRESLITLRRCFDCALFPISKITEAAQCLSHLEQALEIGSTWDRLPTIIFFPDKDRENIRTHLRSEGLLHLGDFLSKSFVDVSVTLRTLGIEYPFLLRRLYETHYLRLACIKTIERRMHTEPLL